MHKTVPSAENNKARCHLCRLFKIFVLKMFKKNHSLLLLYHNFTKKSSDFKIKQMLESKFKIKHKNSKVIYKNKK